MALATPNPECWEKGRDAARQHLTLLGRPRVDLLVVDVVRDRGRDRQQQSGRRGQRCGKTTGGH